MDIEGHARWLYGAVISGISAHSFSLKGSPCGECLNSRVAYLLAILRLEEI